MKKNLYAILGVPLLMSVCSIYAQTTKNDSVALHVTVIKPANTSYNQAGHVKRILMGEHFRKEWATPVEMEVLNLDQFAGGLTPVRLGGGKQTKSLRFIDLEGREWVLRSVNKDPSKAIPEAFSGTFATDFLQDQISSSNPYAPMVVAELSAAAGILHTNPKIVYVPESDKLDSFNKEFANTVCLIEERPVGDQEKNASVGNSKKVVNSQKLFENILTSNRHRMDAGAFLKARLFDMWIGDWDRHIDQWLWASFKTGDKTSYRPIPRDRDQAFSKLDGIIPEMASKPWAVRNTQKFDYTIRDIAGLNMAGNFLDRNFLTVLTENEWTQIAGELQSCLTDSVIDKALRQFPEVIYNLSAKEIMSKLKKRRDDLKKYASDYYSFLIREVEILGTNQGEWFEVNRISEDSTLVKTQYVSRIFLNKETKEIRIYGLGGNDHFDIRGTTRSGPLVRIIGGGGEDSIVDESSVKGWQHKTKIYDQAATVVNPYGEANIYLSHDSLKNSYNPRESHYDLLTPILSPGYNPDDGVYLGGGLVYKKRQFGKLPYGFIQTIWGNYAFATGAYNFGYTGTFKEMAGKWDLQLVVNINAPNYVMSYYGLGNETVRLNTTDKNYYRVRSNQMGISTFLGKPFGKENYFKFGITYQSVRVEKTPGRYISEGVSKPDNSVFDRKYFAGLAIAYQYNNTDNPLFPHRGFRTNTAIEFTGNLQETRRAYGKIYSDVAWFGTVRSFTLALRIGGAMNLGDEYEFYQANYLGGKDHVRGYRDDRFAGKSAVFQNLELRYKIRSMGGYFLRGNYGLLAFLDNGRVWMPGESSNKWHNGYGGGIWFLPYEKMSFSATWACSSEDRILSVKAGFFF